MPMCFVLSFSFLLVFFFSFRIKQWYENDKGLEHLVPVYYDTISIDGASFKLTFQVNNVMSTWLPILYDFTFIR